MHALSKHLNIEDGDGSNWKDPDPDATSHDVVTSTSSDGPHYEHEIEWENLTCGKVMRTSGCNFPDEFDHHHQCDLCGIKNVLLLWLFQQR